MATKRRSRTISLRGVAAKAFVEMHTGMPAKSDDDVLIRLATLVHMNVSSGDMNGAVHLLKDALAQAKEISCTPVGEENAEQDKHEALPTT